MDWPGRRPLQLGMNTGLVDLEVSRKTIDDYADRPAMALTEGCNAQAAAESVTGHLFTVLLVMGNTTTCATTKKGPMERPLSNLQYVGEVEQFSR